MATVRKTITLTDQQDDWIKAQVEGGHYTNDSEYIRDLIRFVRRSPAKSRKMPRLDSCNPLIYRGTRGNVA